MKVKPIAAIDIGTNSAHLAVAEVDHSGHLHVIDTEKIVLRLGDALDAQQMLSPQAILKTIDAMKKMKEIADSYNAPIVAVATHATRNAQNHLDLIERIAAATGIEVNIIDGLEEARLEFLGIRHGLSIDHRTCLAVDIGGGSTEIIVGKEHHFSLLTSLKLGAVILTKRFLYRGLTKGTELEELTKHIAGRLAPITKQAKQLEFSKAIAASGTAKTIAQICAKSPKNLQLGDNNGVQFSTADLLQAYEKMWDLYQPKKIKAAFNLDQNRSEIILAGTAVLAAIAGIFKVDTWTYSSYSLREGLVVDTYLRHIGQKNIKSKDSLRWRSVLSFAQKHVLDHSHAKNVMQLALAIFEQLSPLLCSGYSAENLHHYHELLRSAAYLHEIGKSVSFPKYHKHSAYMLEHGSLLGFNQTDKYLLAATVKYHRKGNLTPTKAAGDEFLSENLALINFLSGCLRLSVCLNRTRRKVCDSIQITQAKDNSLNIKVTVKGAKIPEAERYKAELELPTLAKAFNHPIKLSFQGKG